MTTDRNGTTCEAPHGDDVGTCDHGETPEVDIFGEVITWQDEVPAQHEHTTRTRNGEVIWSTKDECTKCGTGSAFFGDR